jgi:prepilin-type processing-associated H-X9-DG protein
MFRRFLRHKVIRDKGLPLIFPKPPIFPRLLPGTFVGNVNVGFVDGSVHFLKESIDPHIVVSLVTRAGGEIVSADQY